MASTHFNTALAVTPSDSADLPGGPSVALWIGGSGALSVILEGDASPVLISGIVAGTLLPVRAKRVRATGTTATLIVAFTSGS